MKRDKDKPRPERAQTDDSLRAERVESDRLVSVLRSGAEALADELIVEARTRADAVLRTARGRADAALREAHRDSPLDVGPGPALLVTRDRAAADELLNEERADADKDVRRQRAQQASSLAALLPLGRDQTDRHLVTERTRSDEATDQRDDFLGMVSHDLRALLNGIVINSSVLAESSPATEEGTRTLAAAGLIRRYATRMNRLIGDLIDVASIDAGKLGVRPSAGDAALVLREVQVAFAAVAVDAGVVLECDAAAPILLARFDHDRLFQVLVNLTTNALRYTPRGGRVVLHGARADGDLHLRVTDTGVGIPADQLEAVFERFWQVGGAGRGRLGLGLHIARRIVEAHGGRVWAESTVGAGSSFHVRIPVGGPPAAV